MSKEFPKQLDIHSLIDVLNYFSEQDDAYIFRGETADYGTTSCVSSLLRDDNYPSIEDHIIEETMEKYPEYFNDVISNTDILLTLQHYGVPTRLLDVTTNFLVSLFFSCQEDTEDGKIYCFPKSQYVNKSSYSDTISMIASFSRLHQKTKENLVLLVFPIALCITYVFLQVEVRISIASDNISKESEESTSVPLDDVKEILDDIEQNLKEQLELYKHKRDSVEFTESSSCVTKIFNIYKNELSEIFSNETDYRELSIVNWDTLFDRKQLPDMLEVPIFSYEFQKDLLEGIKKVDKDMSSANIIHLRKGLNESIIELKHLAHEVRRYYPGFVNEIDILNFYQSYISSSRNINRRITNQSGMFIFPSVIEGYLKNSSYKPDSITVLKESKDDLLKVLYSMGINEEKIYPELGHYNPQKNRFYHQKISHFKEFTKDKTNESSYSNQKLEEVSPFKNDTTDPDELVVLLNNFIEDQSETNKNIIVKYIKLLEKEFQKEIQEIVTDIEKGDITKYFTTDTFRKTRIKRWSAKQNITENQIIEAFNLFLPGKPLIDNSKLEHLVEEIKTEKNFSYFKAVEFDEALMVFLNSL